MNQAHPARATGGMREGHAETSRALGGVFPAAPSRTSEVWAAGRPPTLGLRLPASLGASGTQTRQHTATLGRLKGTTHLKLATVPFHPRQQDQGARLAGNAPEAAAPAGA